MVLLPCGLQSIWTEWARGWDVRGEAARVRSWFRTSEDYQTGLGVLSRDTQQNYTGWGEHPSVTGVSGPGDVQRAGFPWRKKVVQEEEVQVFAD